MNGNLSSFQKIINICLFVAIIFLSLFFNLRVIPETEELLSRFEEYYWLPKIRRPYEPPLGYANSQYSTKQIWHSDIMRPSRIKLLILCCWKQTFRLCLFWLWTLWTRTNVLSAHSIKQGVILNHGLLWGVCIGELSHVWSDMIVLAFIFVFLLSEVDYTAGEKNTYCFALAIHFLAHFKHTPPIVWWKWFNNHGRNWAFRLWTFQRVSSQHRLLDFKAFTSSKWYHS